MAGITRSKTRSGVTLAASPFSQGKFVDMRIEAEVARPIAGRGAVTARFSFTRLPIAEKFSRSEMIAWSEALRAILEASNDEAAKLRKTADSFETARVKAMPKKKKLASSRR